MALSRHLGSADSYLKQVTPLLETCLLLIPKIIDHLEDYDLHLNFDLDVSSLSLKEITIVQRKDKLDTNVEALLTLELVAEYTKKLKNVLTKYFQALGYPMNKSYLSRKTKRLLKIKNEIDGFLKVVDKIIEYYTFDSAGKLLDEHSLLSLEELKEQKAKICAANEQLLLNELHLIFASYEVDFMPSDESIECAVLGLDGKYEHFLVKLDDKQKEHHDELYYIVRFLDELEKVIEYDPNDKGAKGLCKNLVSLGFTQKRAEAITKIIPSELIDLQTPSYWADRYLNYVFLYHPLLSSTTRYPFSGDKKDEWFQEEIPTLNREEPNENIPSFQIKMLNCTTENSSFVDDYLKKVQEENRESVLLYHGTTHDGAMSILTSGITLGSGKTGQDFSSGDGFYVSKTLEDAKKWSDAARGKHNAVLAFKVNKDLLNASKENALDLTQNEENWQQIVSLCRSRYDDLKVKQKLLKGVSFIKGYMSSNPKAVAHGEERAEGFGQTEIIICIRDEDYAVKFGSLENICCVIFY